MDATIQELLQTYPEVRYAALYQDGKLESAVKPGLSGASAGESDKYEELIVNPTLLKLVTQRGEIDCGGARYLIVRYGNFFEWVQPVRGGHISVGIEPDADPLRVGASLAPILDRHGLL
ncbi:MAG: hypothetical protein LAN71_04365 [Acidobacteriia bacterium]|nr:hypothetical protein [Terriglobia bacterium]